MANKTQPTDQSVEEFLRNISGEQHRSDAAEVCEMMKETTGWPPVLWGPSIVGFGHYHYQYDSGREGDFFRVGFSPRKKDLTIYITPGFGRFGHLMQRLGKYKTGVSCLYLRKLSDVDRQVLRQLIADSLVFMNEKYPAAG